MSGPGGNDDMKWLSGLTDRHIEEALAGRSSLAALADVGVIMAELRAEARREMNPILVEDLVAAAAAAVSALRGEPSRRRVPLRRRLVAPALATALLLLGGGVAWAAHGSNPGSTLHGVDLALEKVGIGAGGATERLHEAAALAGSGAVAEGLEHAAAALGQTQSESAGESAAQALGEAAERIRTNLSTPPEGVADLLEYLASVIGDEGVDGATVSSIARSIRDSVTPPQGSPPEEVPVGPPEEVPAGPPEGVPPDPSAGLPAAGDDPPNGPPEGLPPHPTEEGPPAGIPPAP